MYLPISSIFTLSQELVRIFIASWMRLTIAKSSFDLWWRPWWRLGGRGYLSRESGLCQLLQNQIWATTGRRRWHCLELCQDLVNISQFHNDAFYTKEDLYRCHSSAELESASGPWGDWGDWSDICTLGYVGARFQIEPDQVIIQFNSENFLTNLL